MIHYLCFFNYMRKKKIDRNMQLVQIKIHSIKYELQFYLNGDYFA